MAYVEHRPDRPQPWRARHTLPDGSTRSRSFKLKRDAEAWLAAETTAHRRGEWADPILGKTTFGDWAEQWMASRLHHRGSTRARDASVMRSLVTPTFGARALVSVNPVDVQGWVNGLAASGRAPATVRRAYILAAGVFASAVIAGRLARTPCRGISLPTVTRTEKRFLTAAEVEEVADAIDGRYRAMVTTAAYCGLRWGELAGLRASRVDLLHQTLTVAETLNEVKGKLVFGEPKTAAGRRRLALPAFVAEELAGHIARYPLGESGLLFTAPEGGPLRRGLWRTRVWLPAVRASVGAPLRFHELRHTSAALLIAAGEHPQLVAARLGHTSASFTLTTYGHLFEGADAAAADRLAEVRAKAVEDAASRGDSAPIPLARRRP